MKKLITKIICAALALIYVFSLAACGENSSSTAQSSAAGSSGESGSTGSTGNTGSSSAASSSVSTNKLSQLHQLKTPGDAFTGYWKITEGTGSNLKSFVFCFDGAKTAYLMVGTMGYIGSYELSVKNGENVFSTQLVFGLDGDYTYSFFKNDQTVELTNTADNSTTTMERIDSFTSIPEAPENPQIDKELLGAWLDDTGAYLYFGDDGVMYSAQKKINYTFYTYSAADGKISALSKMTDVIEDEFTYEVKGGTLVFNRYEYKKISEDELV